MGGIGTFGLCHLVFDMDGTLIDSTRGWREALEGAALDFGGVLDEGLVNTIRTTAPRGIAEYIAVRFAPAAGAEAVLSRICCRVGDFYRRGVALRPGVREALDAFRAQGCVCWLLTGTERAQAEIVLDQLDLKRCFQRVLTCTEAGGPKTGPEPFHFVADELGVGTEELVVFDDLLPYLKAARACGCRTVAVYDAPGEPDLSALRQVSDRILWDWRELPATFL